MLVAVTCGRRMGPPGYGANIRPGRPEVYVNEVIVDHLRAVGLTPVLLPPGGAQIEQILAVVGGVVITGGAFDIHPSHYGQPAAIGLGRYDEARTGLELALVKECVRRRVPTLGLCGGMQAIGVALGGRLIQDLTADAESRGIVGLNHEQATDPALPAHGLVCEPGWEWLGGAQDPAETSGTRRSGMGVNSTHHQALDPANPGTATIVARAPDGVVEAIAVLGGIVLGVEWHPELLAQPGACPVFASFSQAVGHAAWSAGVRSKGRFTLPPGSLP